MARLLLKGTEAALGTDTAGANAFSSARLVRLVNVNGSSTYLVSLVATVGGSVVGTFTIPPHTVVELEKEPLQGVFAANANVKGTAIGYSN
tara:strand:- start:490 stop:762 length:273 start_codon:yes stop_codon:yes gene_type:complete